MHQDFKGAALCLSNPTFRNLTKRELYTTVTKQAQGSVLSFYAGTNDENLTVRQQVWHRRKRGHPQKGPLADPNTKPRFSGAWRSLVP